MFLISLGVYPRNPTRAVYRITTMLSKYQSGRESLVKARKSWYTELGSVLFVESRVIYGLTDPDVPSHKALTYINKSKEENEKSKRKTYLNWKDIVRGLSAVF